MTHLMLMTMLSETLGTLCDKTAAELRIREGFHPVAIQSKYYTVIYLYDVLISDILEQT